MKNVILTRNGALSKTTPGALAVPIVGRGHGERIARCATLELLPQAMCGGRKKAGVTRFEAGIYKLKVWTTDRLIGGRKNIIHAPWSKWAKRYTPRYGGVVEICVGCEADGDEWTSVLFHGGNQKKDTLGCTLMGEAFRYRDEFLLESRNALDRVYPHLVKAVLLGAKLEVK